MPIHHRIPSIIGQAIAKGYPTGSKLVNSEKLILNKAWVGFKHKSSIVGGIRTGLFGGAIAGSLINQSADVPNVALPPPYEHVSPSRTSYKTRSGYGRKRRRNCKCGNRFNRRR